MGGIVMFRTRLPLAALAAALIALPAASAGAQQVFAWDFESAAPTLGPFPVGGLSGTLGGGAIADAQALPGFGSSFFHNSSSALSSLTLTGLGAHSRLTVAFDIAFIDTWDGNDDSAICCNPDYLYVTADGDPLLTLSSNNQQGLAPQFQGGSLIGSDHYYRDFDPDNPDTYLDKVVRYNGLAVLTFAHSASTFTLGFRAGGGGWQGDYNPLDESYGVDNVVISAGAVPEPAAWAMMILGFGGAGVTIRRRRTAQA